MRNFKNILILFFIFLIISCDNSIIPYLQVEEVVIKTDKVDIRLSSVPNQNKFMNAFSFYEDDTQIEGSFDFNDVNISFFPNTMVTEGHNYNVEITTELEDITGHSLQYNYFLSKSTKTEDIPPYILSTFPINETKVSDAALVPQITFSESVNRQSFQESFSISPNISYILEWNDDSTSVSIILNKELSKNTTYTLKVGTELKDMQNNSLLNEFKSNFHFYTPDAIEKSFDFNLYYFDPDINLLNEKATTVLSSDVIFKLEFDNIVSEDTISSYVSSYPPLKFSFTPDWKTSKSVTFNLIEKPEWNKEYLITIKKNITDEYNHAIEESKYYHIIFSKEQDKPVEYLKAFFLQKAGEENNSNYWFPVFRNNIYSSLNIPVESDVNQNQSEYNEKKLKLYVAFSISNEATGLNIPSVLKGVKISSTNSCASFMIDNCTFLSQSDYENSPIANFQLSEVDYSQHKLAVVLFDLTVRIYNAEGMIRFSFNEDISDNLGNSMKESLVYSYNKT